MEQGKLASRELAVQKKFTALVSRLCAEFGVQAPKLTPFKPKYMTRSRNLLRNEAVANALQSIVDAIAPEPSAPGADPDSGNVTPVDVTPMAPTVPEALDQFVDDMTDALDGVDLGGADFIPDGDEEAPAHDHTAGADKMVSPKQVKTKGRRR